MPAALIELNVGRDLQAIRIDGTVLGGIIGLCLYVMSENPRLMTPMDSRQQPHRDTPRHTGRGTHQSFPDRCRFGENPRSHATKPGPGF
jgi:hypothetical protein